MLPLWKLSLPLSLSLAHTHTTSLLGCEVFNWSGSHRYSFNKRNAQGSSHSWQRLSISGPNKRKLRAMFQVFIAKSASGSCLQSTSHPFQSRLPGLAQNKTKSEKIIRHIFGHRRWWSWFDRISRYSLFFHCLYGAELLSLAHNLQCLTHLEKAYHRQRVTEVVSCLLLLASVIRTADLSTTRSCFILRKAQPPVEAKTNSLNSIRVPVASKQAGLAAKTASESIAEQQHVGETQLTILRTLLLGKFGSRNLKSWYNMK